MALNQGKNSTIVLGAGLTGLAAGYTLTKAGKSAVIFDADCSVGGLSKTIFSQGYRFDLGGHRFYTKDKKIEEFVRNLMGQELLTVLRKSRILLRGKFFDYPLRPLNSMFGLGLSTTVRIIADYSMQRLMPKASPDVSLEDWVIRNFGRTMFNIYFKQYSEKVWGIDCKDISRDWVSKRISGLSLGKAIKNAFFHFSGKDLPTLADRFLYPKLGIGRISERLREDIEKSNTVYTNTIVTKILHKDFKIESVSLRNCDSSYSIECKNVVSSIPLTAFVKALSPAPPEDVLKAADSLGYRDLVVVTVMINKPRITGETWIYIPEKSIPFGRIHEPTNWSPFMAPEGKTLLVTEYFCFAGDDIWNSSDSTLSAMTVEHLENLGFVKKDDIEDVVIVRAPKAYPLFRVGYERHLNILTDYLSRFKNLCIAGRGGMFRYYNMDHAIESGIKAAESILKAADR